MHFNPPLTTATLIRRYKRFLVDAQLADGSTLTIHCPNTGSMRSCSEPGSPIAMSISDNPKRKYPHTLEMVQSNGTWIGVNTGLTNRLVADAIANGQVAEFPTVTAIRREVKVSGSSRLDLAVSHDNLTTYIEIKNCSLVEEGRAMFPDAVTSRGTKHLQELMTLAERGHGACIFFLVQRMDADSFSPAAHIDPVYSRTLLEASQQGVQVLAYQADVSPAGIEVVRQLPCQL